MKQRIWFFGFLLLLVACSTNTSPRVLPSLTSSFPGDGASDVALDGNLSLVFSKPMNQASVQIALNPETDLGQGTWNDTSTQLSFTLTTPLAPETSYSLTVSGKDATGLALAPKQLSFRTVANPTPEPPPAPDIQLPATPINPSAKPGDKSVLVSWTANTEPDLESYTVYWGTSATVLANSSVVDKAQNSKLIEGLSNGTAYFFALSAKNSGGYQSAKSVAISATPTAPPAPGDTTPPAVPKNFSATATETEINLSWQANSEPDLKGYNLYSGTAANALSLVGFVDKASVSRKIGGLNSGTTYYFALEAEDYSGNKSTKTVAVSATPKDATAPKLLSSNPANGAKNVSPNLASISFSFSEPMQTNSVQLNCTVVIPTLPAAQCGLKESAYFDTPVWSNNNRTLTFTRRGPALFPGMGPVYRLEIIGGRDKAGNALGDVLITFETDVLPELVSSVPANNAQNVPSHLGQVSFKFSKSMNPASLKLRCESNQDTCNAALSELLGKPTWGDQNRTLTYKPTRDFFENISYGWALEGKDSSGLSLGNTVVRFSTAPIPMLNAAVPPDGAQGIPNGAYISLIFNNPMNVESLKAAISGSVNSRDGSTTRALSISNVIPFSPPQGGYGYSFVPTTPHGDGMVVVWVLSREAKSIYGNPIPQIVSGGFRTLQRFIVTVPVDPKMIGRVYRICEGIAHTLCSNGSQGGVLLAGYAGGSTNEQITVERAGIGFTYNSDTFPSNAQFARATLTLRGGGMTGTPFAQDKLGPLSIERINMGSKVDGDDFDTKALPCYLGQTCLARFNGPPDPVSGDVDVLDYFLADWADRSTRGYHTHFRLRFANNKPISGGEDQQQLIFYNTNPTLTVEYLIP